MMVEFTRPRATSIGNTAMASANELTKMMDNLEDDARRILANPDMAPFGRRRAMEQLLARYLVLSHYKRALTAYIKRMQQHQDGHHEGPEAVTRDIMSSPEFVGLQMTVFAALLAAIYADGPRASWVPVALLPVMMTTVCELRM